MIGKMQSLVQRQTNRNSRTRRMTQTLWRNEARRPAKAIALARKTLRRRQGERALFASMLAASALPSSPFLRCETSRPAVVKTASRAALVNSNPVKVASRAPAIHNPPTRVPTLMDKDDTPVTVLTKDANGLGRSVLPEDLTRSRGSSVDRIWSAAGSLSRV